MARKLPNFSQEVDYLEFGGRIELVENVTQLENACKELHELEIGSHQSQIAIGFDCEWTVDSIVGSKKTSLIQICPNEEVCYLFHLPAFGQTLPLQLKRIMVAKKFLKVGLNIECDFWKLDKDFDIPALHIFRNCCCDVAELSKSILPASKERWSLDGLCKHILHKKLCKDTGIRVSNWDTTLSPDQIKYAAVDAFASLLVYQKLIQRSKYNQM